MYEQRVNREHRIIHLKLIKLKQGFCLYVFKYVIKSILYIRTRKRLAAYYLKSITVFKSVRYLLKTRKLRYTVFLW